MSTLMIFAVFLSTSPARGTTSEIQSCKELSLFLSTSPARGTTGVHGAHIKIFKISIHVPREGDDDRYFELFSPTLDFYPRPPRGGRPRLLGPLVQWLNFYPRPPRGGRPDSALRFPRH